MVSRVLADIFATMHDFHDMDLSSGILRGTSIYYLLGMYCILQSYPLGHVERVHPTDGTCIKPKQIYTNKYRGKVRDYGSKNYRYFSTDCDKTMNISRENFGKKEILIDLYILLVLNSVRPKKILELRSFLHDDFIDVAPCIGKFINIT